MATYTSNYAWAKPEGSDPVDIGVLNNNLDSQDAIVHNAYMQLAPVFSSASTYAVDDVVLYSNNLYKCHTAVTVAGDWTGATNWTQVKVSDIAGGGGGGGTSDYTQLTNKPSINSVTLSGNKTSADLGLQDAIQIDTMPAASATYAGKIVQFVGTTDATYTHGYYYECTNNGGAYTWTQLNVQPSSGGGTSDYTDLTNKPQINGVTLTGNKSTSDLGITAAGVGLGNVPNVATDDQTPTFTTAQSRNNLVSGEKLSIMLGKISKFFNDLKTVAFTGNYSDLVTKLGIKNSAGTDLTARNTLQFTGGLAVSDDSTNERTVVSDDYELITWADWQTIVANHEENLHPNAIITGVPDADGDISVELMTKLWENPSPTASFSAQNIQLSSSDYDLLLVIANMEATNPYAITTIFEKGKNGIIGISTGTSGFRFRQFTYSDATTIAVGSGNKNGTDDTVCIPIAIYGIKTTASVKVSAIAENVSTSADKCMLSDGVTSVEDRLDVKTIDGTYTTDSYGRFNISALKNKNVSILRAYTPDNSYIVIPYNYYNSSTQSILTYFKIELSETASYAVIANTNVAVHIDYVEF